MTGPGERGALAAAEVERRRVATELHDVVAHGLTVIAMQAAVLRTLEGTERRREVEASIEEVARQSLVDLRRLLTALHGTSRNEDADVSDVADLPERLAGLAAGLEAAGYTVRSAVDGAARLPPSLRLTVLRVAQEAVANIVLHGPGTGTVHLSVQDEADGVVVRVESPQSAAGPELGHRAEPDTGGGLAGMRERVALFGGRLTSGPGADGRWSVHAALPHR